MDLETLAQRMEIGFQSLHVELAEVKRQAIVTNGRITTIERWKSYMDGVQAGAGGLWQYAVAVFGIAGMVVGIVVSLR